MTNSTEVVKRKIELNVVVLGITTFLFFIWFFMFIIGQAFVLMPILAAPESKLDWFFVHYVIFPIVYAVFYFGGLILSRFSSIWHWVVLLPVLFFCIHLYWYVDSQRLKLEQFENVEQRRFIKACAYEDSEEIQDYLNAGFDVNLVGDLGLTPLHAAAIGKDIENFEFLLRSGADPNLFPNGEFEDNIAFQICSWIGDLHDGREEYLSMLIDYGLNVNLTDDRFSLIRLAVYNKHTRYIKILLNNGVDVNFRIGDRDSTVAIPTLYADWDNAVLIAEYSNRESLLDAAAILANPNSTRKVKNEGHPQRKRLQEIIERHDISEEDAIAHLNKRQAKVRLKFEAIERELELDPTGSFYIKKKPQGE